ncbi:MAG: hypothetical protein JRI39_03705 [Deltaproteobacteria bacterium]|nr:hypothetical protein [Deltaproteobacteria bacterium]MBW2082201.1 hypothetical protein [Deltaproteobacteria bacterium]HDM09203.1 hypothetical protein [Desulfobacteraceae bacterium]
MGSFEIFVIRALLSGLFAFFLCRFFFKQTPAPKVVGLAVLMLGLAYLLEYVRKRNQGGSDES